MKVFDIREDPTICRWKPFLGWLRSQGVDPNDIYRVEVLGKVMKVYGYKRGGDGKLIVESGAVVTTQRNVPVKGQPPEWKQ